MTRVKQGKAYVYTPSLSLEFSRQEALAELLQSYFEGSRELLMEYLENSSASIHPSSRSDSTTAVSKTRLTFRNACCKRIRASPTVRGLPVFLAEPLAKADVQTK